MITSPNVGCFLRLALHVFFVFQLLTWTRENLSNKIRHKERLEKDLLKTESREIFFILYDGGTEETSVNFSNIAELYIYIFVRLRHITFKLENRTDFKALFPMVSTDFP